MNSSYFMGEVIPITLKCQKKELCPFLAIIPAVLLADLSNNELLQKNRWSTHSWRRNGCPTHL